MAIYKSSNCSPQLSEIDFTQNNTFSCVVNTTGEPAKAYKLKIMSENGDTTYYEPQTPTTLTIPVSNKDILRIKNVSDDLNANLVNGKNYLWGVRVYNAPVSSSAQPNTLVAEGFVVGSTKYVIWSRIPKAQTGALEQLKYDRYIEFTNIAPANMFKGAKDDIYPLLPISAYTERRKIDWVTTELGNDEDIVKIETTEPFTYNYVDGVEYNIYQCSDEHTVKSAFADPNSNINISNFIMIYSSLSDAQSARTAEDNPSSITVTQAPCMQILSSTGYSARKIVGYSSDTGEIRIMDSFAVAPENGQYYRLFEYDTLEKRYKPVDDEISEDNVDPLVSHRIGGIAITNSTYYKVLNNLWGPSTKRLFIQPNINILPDDTNPDEIVFENGARIDIVKKTRTVDGEVVDITFNKLDNTQWMIEGSHLTYSGTVPTICQTDYKVFTDFSDVSPYNLFYARQTPLITLQYRNAWEEMLKGVYINSTTFNDENGEPFTPSVLYLYHDIPNDEYYRWNIYSYEYELVTDVWYNIDDDPTKYRDFREVEFRCLWESSENAEMLDPQIKNYQFSLFAYDEYYTKKTLIKQSDECYDINPHWIFRGLDGTLTSSYNRNNPHKYSIQIKIIDEYDKEYIVENAFYIFYVTDESPMPISVELNCDEQALDVEINSPAYATTIDSEDLTTVTQDDLNISTKQVVIGEDQTLNYAKMATDDIDLVFPSTFSLYTQFQITKEFVESIPNPSVDTGFSELPLFEIVHRLHEVIIYSGTTYYSSTIPFGTTYYSNDALTQSAGTLAQDTKCELINSSCASVIVNNNIYYVEPIESGTTENDIVSGISLTNSAYSTIILNGSNFYVLSSDVDGPVLEKFTVKINSFEPFYHDSLNNLYRNNDQYKIKIYKDDESSALPCFTLNGSPVDYYNVIINNSTNISGFVSVKETLQSLTDSDIYVEVSSLGNPSDSFYQPNKRYVLYTASPGYSGIVYSAGIYRILENQEGHKYWGIAEENEYLFLEETDKLQPSGDYDYDDLSVPINARGDAGSSGDINFTDNNNIWLDSTLTMPSYAEILYNKYVNLFLKVVSDESGNQSVSCEISLTSQGA